MPHVQVRSTSTGAIWCLDSSRPELIAQWLMDTLEQIQPEETTPAQVTFTHLWIRDPDAAGGRRPDWPISAELNWAAHLTAGEGAQTLRILAKSLTDRADGFEHMQAAIESERKEYEEGQALLRSSRPSSAQA